MKKEGIFMNNKLLANIFTDGVILQRDKKIKVWGWCDFANSPVIVKLWVYEDVGECVDKCIINIVNPANVPNEHKTTSEANGSWEVEIVPHPAGGPYTLEVFVESDNAKGIDGTRASQKIKDVYFGEVWILGGQSNMELPMDRIRRMFPNEIEESDNPFIRHFVVPQDYKFNGLQQEIGTSMWQKASAKTTGSFSAVGYFFGKKLYEKLHVPIGLVMAAVGGTPLEAWMSEEMLKEFPDSLELLKLCKDEKYVTDTIKSEGKETNEWYQRLDDLDVGLAEKWYKADFIDDFWSFTTLENSWDENEELKSPGVIWFRYQVEVLDELANRPASLLLGCIEDADTTYVNGEVVGSTGYRYPPRDYPANNLKPGMNIIAIRVISTRGIGGFVQKKPYKLVWDNIGHSNDDTEILLNGKWKYKRSIACPKAPETTFFQYKPTGTYNSMIAPLLNLGMQGVAWYQGESNTGAPGEYEKRFGRMVEGWRHGFNQGDFPFLFVQLANWSPKGEPINWAPLREAQRKASQSVHNSAMVVTYDVGEETDLHPLDKKAVGERLAWAALKKAYGQDVVAGGPTLARIDRVKVSGKTREDNKGNNSREDNESSISGSIENSTKNGMIDCVVNGIEDNIKEKWVLHFDNIGTGLCTRNDGELGGFSIWIGDCEIPVQATLVNNDVELQSPKLLEANTISYGWADNPKRANLYNKEGFPTEPFMEEL